MAIEDISEYEMAAAARVAKSMSAAVKQAEILQLMTTTYGSALRKTYLDNATELQNHILGDLGIDSTIGFVDNAKNISAALARRMTDSGTSMVDLQGMLNQLMQTVMPFKNAFATLQKMSKDIPGIGPILQLLALLQSNMPSSGLAVSLKLSDLPKHASEATQNIWENMQTFVSALPMVFISIIFEILHKLWDVIQDMLKKLGIDLANTYPLNMIADIMATIKTVLNFIVNAPGLIKDMFTLIARSNMQLINRFMRPIVRTTSKTAHELKCEEATMPPPEVVEAAEKDPWFGEEFVDFITTSCQRTSLKLGDMYDGFVDGVVNSEFIQSIFPTDPPKKIPRVDAHVAKVEANKQQLTAALSTKLTTNTTTSTNPVKP